MRNIMTVVVAFFVSGVALAALSELEEDHELSMEYVTPHTDWAQPYILGKTRVLYFGWGFGPGHGTDTRDLIELMQRFDIEAQAALYAQICDMPETGWHGGPAGVRRILRLLEKPYDCFIFHAVEPARLPPEAQYKVLKSVTEGAGLVLIGADDPRVLKPSYKIEPVPEFLAASDAGEAFSIKRGRGVRLPPRPDIRYRVGWEVEYDYWIERLGRAVLWASGKEPPCQVSIVSEAEKVPVEQLPGAAAKVTWQWVGQAPKMKKLRLSVRLRRDDGAVWELAEADAAGGKVETGAVNATLPALRAGDYHIEAFTDVDGKRAGWGTRRISVTAARVVQAIGLERNWGEVGEPVRGAVSLAGPAGAAERVMVELVDVNGRVLVRKNLPASGNGAAFELPTYAWMPMLLRVEGSLWRANQEISRRYEYYRVTRRNRGQWNFLVWDYPTGAAAPWAEKALAEIGCSIHLHWGEPTLMAAAYNIAQVPYTTRILDPKDERGHMLPFCWNDAEAVEKATRELAEKHRPSREHGVFVYSLGDEGVTRGCCLAPTCLAAYREYLRKEYGDIAALNASWGTDYSSFDEVELSRPDDNEERTALANRNYPRWFDRQAFACWNLVQYCAKYRDAFAAIDPQACTGFEGTGTLASGDDFDLIVRTLGFWSPYPGPGDEIIRSIAPRDFPRANWMGYTKDADSLLRVFWRMVTRGMDAVWWWRWDSAPPFRGLLAPHGDYYRAVKDMVADTRVVREGLGTLLLHSAMQDDGIALLYSFPSAYACRVEAGPSYGAYADAHVAWHAAIRNLGFQFGYVTDRQLRLGEFDPKRWKVVILPRAEALGPKEAQVLRAFVEGGGTLIADVRPGLFHNHCKPLAGGCLDDLFGVRQTANVEAAVAELAVGGLSAAGCKVDPAVALNGGTAAGRAGEIPVWISRKVGRGRAVLLNVSMSSFPRAGAAETPEAAYEVLAALFEEAGVKPQLSLQTPAGKPVRNCEIVRWLDGDIEVVALFREAGPRETAVLALPAARHVYDLRANKYWSKAAKVAVEIIPARATFLALSPTQLGGPKVSLSKPAAAPGEVLVATVAAPGAGGQVAVKLALTKPDGTRANWLPQYVISGPKGVKVSVPVAYNDPEGRWLLTATELFSAKESQVGFVVK
ncbi:MAG: beta-galactosidase [Armatimonadetes bacterium]|nr:beta-galactosidase [Armatimonadota bacterium]